MRLASTWSTTPVRRAVMAAPEVARHHRFHAGADERRVGAHQRHRLALHVGAHQSAVGVVILEERNERGRDRDELLRRHVDEIDLLARHGQHVAMMARDHQLLGELAVLGQRHVGLGDVMLALLDRRQIDRPRRSPCRSTTLR